MDIIKITNASNQFYSLIGPFLANRDVEKELGYSIYDEPDKEWFLAIDDASTIGFCYRQETSKGKFKIGSCYVIKEKRGRGIFEKILCRALDGISGEISITTNNNFVIKTLQKYGFNPKQKRGKYTVYGREL